MFTLWVSFQNDSLSIFKKFRFAAFETFDQSNRSGRKPNQSKWGYLASFSSQIRALPTGTQSRQHVNPSQARKQEKAKSLVKDSNKMEFFFTLPFQFLEPPNLKIKKPTWIKAPSAMFVFSCVLLSYFLVTGGKVLHYDFLFWLNLSPFKFLFSFWFGGV